MAYLDDNGLLYLWNKIKNLVSNKVDKVSGKQLSTNDYSTAERNKLSGIAEGANKTNVDSAWSTASLNPVQNKLITTRLDNLDDGVLGLVNFKVDKEDGKQLSTQDYSTAEKTKLAGLNNFTHPTTDGNKHVPATGTASNGKALIAGSTAGAFSWQILTKSMVSLGSVDNTSDLNKPVSSAVHNALNNKVDLITDLDINSSLERSRGMNIVDGVVVNNASDAMLLLSTGPFEAAFFANGTQKVRYKEYDGNRNPVWTGWVTNNIFSDVLLTKLNGIATNANNYMHPTMHPATIITDDTTHRFVTDIEKNTWNAKASTAVATTTTSGLMAAADKSKLEGIQAQAQKNQNAFSSMNYAGTVVNATSQTDTVYVAYETCFETSIVKPDGKDRIMVSIKDATTGYHGAMSAVDKSKLDAFGAASTYALKADIVGMYKYKGSVADASKLPTTGQTTGDVYNIVAPSIYGAAGANVAWDGSKWDSLGEIFTITSITNAQIDTICA